MAQTFAEKISIDLKTGEICCNAGNFDFLPLPKTVQEIKRAGGLVVYVRRELANR